MSASPGSVSVVQGAAGTSSISTALVSGTAESIGLSISGLPTGVSGRLQPGVRHGRRQLEPDPHGGRGDSARDLPADGHRHGDLGHPHHRRQPDRHGGLGRRPALALDRHRRRSSPAVAGSAAYAGGVFTVNGSGADIFGTSDQFNYVYQPVTGNGTLIARVTTQTDTGSSNSKAGLIWKASTTSGSPYFLIAVTTGASSRSSGTSTPPSSPPRPTPSPTSG